VGGQRELESRVIFASGDDQARAEATIDSLDEFHNARKILVFVNSRKQVDSGAGYFRYGRFEKTPVFGHHGSLSKHERERTESRFKLEPTAICVATMTLEVGIDIGDVDLVVCMDPPFSLSSFLQRIGRGSRRRAGLTRVLCVARDRAGVLMFNALIYQARLSMPRVPLPPFRRSVLVQQILAYLKQVPRNARVLEQFLRVFASDAKPRIAAEDVESIVQDLVAENVLSKQRDVFLPASRGWDFIESNKIFSNIQPSPLEVALVDVDSGRVVARVKSVAPGAEGVRVAGTSYRLLKGGRGNVQPVRSDDGHDASPKYHARSLPYSAEVGASLAAYLEIRPEELVEVRVGQNAVLMTWLGKLNNALIAAELSRRSLKCSYGAFHVSLAVDSQRDLLQMLKESVVGILAHNPLPDLGIERMVDLGPHWQYLSPDMQRYGKADWLDRDYLHDWSSNLNHLREVSPSSDLGVNLLDLT
jgi:Lhr-like helicase